MVHEIIDEVLKDMEAQRRLGIQIPAEAEQYVRTHEAEIVRYRDEGMKIHEISDLVVQLVGAWQ